MNCNTCKKYPCEWVSELQSNGVTTTEIIKKRIVCLEYEEGKPKAYNHEKAEKQIRKLQEENAELKCKIKDFEIRLENMRMKEYSGMCNYYKGGTIMGTAKALEGIEKSLKTCHGQCDICSERCNEWQKGYNTGKEREIHSPLRYPGEK